MSEPGVHIEPVGAEHGDLLEDLFRRNDVHCFCRYWHHAGDSNAWLERLFHRPEDNRTEMRAALARGCPQMLGAVALHGGRAIGWMKLAPADALEKLYQQRLYRGLRCLETNRSSTYAVACLLVDAPWRRTGVAASLIQRAGLIARQYGAQYIEAFPRRTEEVADAQLWMGPVSAFERAGFRTVHDAGPYPVFRLELA